MRAAAPPARHSRRTRTARLSGDLAATRRLLEPVRQILDGHVYMHQFKVNAKAAFDGEVWQWHQDYGVWQRDDEMPEPRAMNIALFLEEVTPANGPLLFIPKSHKQRRARRRA